MNMNSSTNTTYNTNTFNKASHLPSSGSVAIDPTTSIISSAFVVRKEEQAASAMMVRNSSSRKRVSTTSTRTQSPKTRNAMIAAAKLMLSLSLAANHMLASSFIISNPSTTNYIATHHHHIPLSDRLLPSSTLSLTSSPPPPPPSSSSSSQLEMVSMAERVMQESSLGTTSSSTTSASASALSTPTTKRTSRRRRSTTTTTATATAKKANVRVKRTTRTSNTKSKQKSTTKSPSSRIVSSNHNNNDVKNSSSSSSVNNMAKTAESLYNLPTYEEESKHWQEVDSILNNKIYYEDQTFHEKVLSSNDNITKFGTNTTYLSSSSAGNKVNIENKPLLEKTSLSAPPSSSSSTTTSMEATVTTTTKKAKPLKKQRRQRTTLDSSSSSSSSSPPKSRNRPSITTLTKASKNSTPTKDNSSSQLFSTKLQQHKSLSQQQQQQQQQQKKYFNRSSTMPGFLNPNHTRAHTSFRDGIRIVQKANGKNHNAKVKLQKVVQTERNSRKRKKANSEAMYASSASVPDSLIAFTNEIHLEDRITPKEEVELGTRTQEAIRLQRIYDSFMEKYGREPSDDEWCAAAGKINMDVLQDAIQDGIHAKNQLVTSNLRMVQGVVNLYIRNGLGSQYNAGDLMQEGTVALIRAAEKFEPERGFRFSTYAMYWIRAAVKRSQILQSRVINVPQRLHETHKKVVRIEGQLKKELSRRPTDSELAVACGITETQLERCRSAIAQQCFSLDAEIVNTRKPNNGDKGSETSHNRITAKYDDVEYRELQSHLMKEDLVSTLRRYLSPHEVDLLLLRYGLMDEKTLQYGFSGPLTIAEVSRLVGLKPDKVRRMINKSLRQLRHLIAHEWEDFESAIQRY